MLAASLSVFLSPLTRHLQPSLPFRKLLLRQGLEAAAEEARLRPPLLQLLPHRPQPQVVAAVSPVTALPLPACAWPLRTPPPRTRARGGQWRHRDLHG